MIIFFLILFIFNFIVLIFVIHLNVFPELSNKFNFIPKVEGEIYYFQLTKYKKFKVWSIEEMDYYQKSDKGLICPDIDTIPVFLWSRLILSYKDNRFFDKYIDDKMSVFWTKNISEYILAKNTGNYRRKSEVVKKVVDVLANLCSECITFLLRFAKKDGFDYLLSKDLENLVIETVNSEKKIITGTVLKTILFIIPDVIKTIKRKGLWYLENTFLLYKNEVSRQTAIFLIRVVDNIYTIRNTRLILQIVRKIMDSVREFGTNE